MCKFIYIPTALIGSSISEQAEWMARWFAFYDTFPVAKECECH